MYGLGQTTYGASNPYGIPPGLWAAMQTWTAEERARFIASWIEQTRQITAPPPEAIGPPGTRYFGRGTKRRRYDLKMPGPGQELHPYLARPTATVRRPMPVRRGMWTPVVVTKQPTATAPTPTLPPYLFQPTSAATPTTPAVTTKPTAATPATEDTELELGSWVLPAVAIGALYFFFRK